MAIYFRRWTRMKNIDKVKLFYDLEVGETPPEIEVVRNKILKILLFIFLTI